MVYTSKDKLWWNEKPKAEILEHAKKNDIILWPLGSVEQHGDHLPTGEDTYHGMEISERVARKTGVMLLPPPWYGAHPYHHYNYPGTLPLSPETFLGMVEDVVKAAALAGFNKFILLNVHGQEWVLPVAIQKFGLENYFVIAPTLWELMRKDFNEILDTYFIHACEAETSLGLAIVPELVKMDKALDETRENLMEDKWFSMPSEAGPIFAFAGTFYRPEYKQLKKGSIGYPTKATAEKGEKIIEVAVNKIVELIEEIKRRYPPGVKPNLLE